MPVAADLTVRRIMSAEPVRITPDQPVEAAVELMSTHRVGAVLVADEKDKLLGIFTERDFLRQSRASSARWQTVPIRDWMSPQPYTIHPDAGWEEAVDSMQRLRVRHLPVVENGKLVGIVTARQLMAQRANHLNLLVAERTRELRLANESLLARDAEVNHYMKAAARLQKRMILPQTAPDLPEVAWGVHYSSLDPLGGDLYAFARPDENHVGVLIADASGHGVPAAMVAILARQAFLEAARTTTRPAEVLSAMNERLQDMTDERFVTAFYGVLDRRTRLFTYANAGHPFPVWYSSKSGQAVEISARGFMLGIMPEEMFNQAEVQLEPGDRLCLFTDGVADCRDERGATFGHDRVRELLPGMARGTAASITEAYVSELNAFRGSAKPVDDMTLMVGEIR